MENRIARLESNVGYIKGVVGIKLDTRTLVEMIGATNESVGRLQYELDNLAAIRSTLATKADFKAMETNMIRWFVGTAIVLIALTYLIARFVEIPSPFT